MPEGVLQLDGYTICIYDHVEDICVSVFRDREVVELFRLRDGHPAHRWDDERIAKYVVGKLQTK